MLKKLVLNVETFIFPFETIFFLYKKIIKIKEPVALPSFWEDKDLGDVDAKIKGLPGKGSRKKVFFLVAGSQGGGGGRAWSLKKELYCGFPNKQQ